MRCLCAAAGGTAQLSLCAYRCTRSGAAGATECVVTFADSPVAPSCAGGDADRSSASLCRLVSRFASAGTSVGVHLSVALASSRTGLAATACLLALAGFSARHHLSLLAWW